MAVTGYTTAYNFPLRDNTLSLSAKGLYLIIKSFIGLPDFQLTKRRLAKCCCDSAYGLDQAWHELKSKGYLRHYYCTGNNGAFCHAYDLLQQSSDPVLFKYSPDLHRPNGDCRVIEITVGDFTKVSTSIIRDSSLSLATKALFALVSHLMEIPNFILRPDGIRYFCKEKIKKFTTLWRKFKLSGLLKQHRYPAGETNKFTYSYDLCQQPDMDSPYLTNHHYDGSVSSVITIASYVGKLNKKIKTAIKAARSIIPQNKKKDKPRAVRRKERREIENKIGYDLLRQTYDHTLVGIVTTAVYNLFYFDSITIKGQKLSRESRSNVISTINADTIASFMRELKINLSAIKGDPVPYMQSVIYDYHQKLLHQPAMTAAHGVSHIESEWIDPEWLERVTRYRDAHSELTESDKIWLEQQKQIQRERLAAEQRAADQPTAEPQLSVMQAWDLKWEEERREVRRKRLAAEQRAAEQRAADQLAAEQLATEQPTTDPTAEPQLSVMEQWERKWAQKKEEYLAKD